MNGFSRYAGTDDSLSYRTCAELGHGRAVSTADIALALRSGDLKLASAASLAQALHQVGPASSFCLVSSQLPAGHVRAVLGAYRYARLDLCWGRTVREPLWVVGGPSREAARRLGRQLDQPCVLYAGADTHHQAVLLTSHQPVLGSLDADSRGDQILGSLQDLTADQLVASYGATRRAGRNVRVLACPTGRLEAALLRAAEVGLG